MTGVTVTGNANSKQMLIVVCGGEDFDSIDKMPTKYLDSCEQYNIGIPAFVLSRNQINSFIYTKTIMQLDTCTNVDGTGKWTPMPPMPMKLGRMAIVDNILQIIRINPIFLSHHKYFFHIEYTTIHPINPVPRIWSMKRG